MSQQKLDVTNQDKIRYLKRYKLIDNSINNLLREKEMWQTRAEKITQTFTGMPSGGDGENQRELAICKMIDCENDVVRLIDQFVDLGNEIKAIINRVTEDELRLLLENRYIHGKTFEQMAVDMHYSWRWIHVLHKKALSKLFIEVHI